MKLSLKTRNWISHIIIFLFPVIFLGVFALSIFNNGLYNDALQKNLLTLQKTSNLIDSQMKQVYQIPIDISLMDSYRNFRMKDNINGALSVKLDLRNRMMLNNFVSDIYLYFYGDDYLISPQTTVLVSDFQSIIYDYLNWEQEDFEEALNTQQKLIRSSEPVTYLNNQQLQTSFYQTTFLMPVGDIKGAPYATAIITVKDDRILNLTDNSGLDPNSEFIIFDKLSNKPIFSSMKDGTDKELVTKNVSQTDGGRVVALNGTKYHIVQRSSTESSLVYLSVTPMSILLEASNNFKLMFFIGLGLITITVLIAIHLFIKQSYTPIKNLRQFSETLVFQHGEENPFLKDEIDYIKRSLEYLNNNNLSLQNQVLSGKDNLKNCLIFDLIRGEYQTLSKFNEAATQANITLNNELYAVVIIYSKAYKKNMASEIIDAVENNSINVPYMLYGHQHFDNDKVVLIANLKSEDTSRLFADMQALNSFIIDKYSISPTIGVGQCYNKVNLISKSFIEAEAAVNYRVVKGGGCVISYEESLPEYSMEQLLSDGLEQLSSSLKKGDYDATKNFLSSLQQRIEKSQVPIYVVKGVCFDVVGEIQAAASSIFTLPLAYCDTLDILEYDTTKELFDMLDVVCRSICESAVEMSQQKEQSRINSMIRYIEANYKNPDFSTDSMADEFSLSSPALCQYFKVKTSKTISDYLTDFRMKRAKELLTSTNFPLNQIAYDVGYYNVSSFIRRFKQMVGSSPGVYRDSMKNH